MLKQVFTGARATTIAVVLYLAGGGLWLAGMVSRQPRPLFYTAGALLVAAYLWTLGWIWMHPGFRRSKHSQDRRYSDSRRAAHSDRVEHEYAKNNPERRKRRLRSSKRRLRWGIVACSAVAFTILGAEFRLSYDREIARIEQMRLQVFLVDSKNTRTRALVAPSNQGSGAKEMMFALEGIPTEVVKVRNTDRSMLVNVVVRNSGDLGIENAHITISSSVPIKSATRELTRVSDTELRAEVDDLPAFRRTGTETSFSVEVPIPEFRVRAGLFVTVSGEGMRPYSAAARVLILKPVGQFPVEAEQTAGGR